MGIPEVIQSLFLLMCSIVGWAIKNTLKEELSPMKDDLKQLRLTMDQIVNILKDHVEAKHPHNNFEDFLDERFVTRKEFEQIIELLQESQEDKDLN